MNETPPDEIDELYRRAVACDPSRPDEGTRRSIVDHATRLATRRGRQRSWRPALVGMLAAACLAGLLVIPRLWTPPASAPASTRDAARAGAPATAPAPRAEYAPAHAHAPAPVPTPISPAPAWQPPAEQSLRSAAAARSVQLGESARQARRASVVDAAAALRRAAQAGDLLALKETLGQPVDVDARDERGRTALLLAILNGQSGAVDALLAHGADPNAADAAGTTPLAAALGRDDPSIVSALRRAGAHADQ